MREPYRVLVTPGDRLGNIEQIEVLQTAGWSGPVSYEAFSSEVYASTTASANLAASMEVIRTALAR